MANEHLTTEGRAELERLAREAGAGKWVMRWQGRVQGTPDGCERGRVEEADTRLFVAEAFSRAASEHIAAANPATILCLLAENEWLRADLRAAEERADEWEAAHRELMREHTEIVVAADRYLMERDTEYQRAERAEARKRELAAAARLAENALNNCGRSVPHGPENQKAHEEVLDALRKVLYRSEMGGVKR